jgi:hypothetical protein
LALLFILSSISVSEAQDQNLQPQLEQPAQPAGAGLPPDVVVTVNGDPITRRELDIAVQRQLSQLQAQTTQELGPEVIQQIKPQAVDTLVESRLVEQYALQKGPPVKDEEVKASVDHLKEQLSTQGNTFDQYLNSQGYTEKSFEKRIKGSIAWHKLQQAQLTPEKLARYFQNNRNRFKAESLDQAQQEVISAYMEDMWNQVVKETKPEAEIRAASGQTGQPQSQDSPSMPRYPQSP